MRNEIEKLNRERDHLADVIKAQGESAVVFGCKFFVKCEGTLLLHFLFFPFPPAITSVWDTYSGTCIHHLSTHSRICMSLYR